MKISEIIQHLESIAPLSFQESYDNSGLLLGDAGSEINFALLTLDVTEEVLDEAIRKKAGLIIAHHPIIFKGIKKITGSNTVERIIIKAIKENAHTGEIGDGKIFILPLEKAIRIRTGEEDEDVL